MIASGLFFCVASLLAVFGGGFTGMLRGYRESWFVVTFLFSYGILGGATSVFHTTFLTLGWPSQVRAGLYAIGVGLAAAIGLVGVMSFAP